MKKSALIRVAISSLVLGAAYCAWAKGGYQYAQVSGIRYKIRKSYNAAGEKELGFDVTLDSFLPFNKIFAGWNNYILILITEFQNDTAADLWNRLYGPNRQFPGRDYNFTSRKRINENMTWYTTESNKDIYVPDQDMATMDVEFIICDRKSELFPSPSCQLYFVKKRPKMENYFWNSTSRQLRRYKKSDCEIRVRF